MTAGARAASGGFNIDGNVPDAGAAFFGDPSGATSELGAKNASYNKVGDINTHTPTAGQLLLAVLHQASATERSAAQQALLAAFDADAELENAYLAVLQPVDDVTLAKMLRELKPLQHVGEIRQKGFMVGIELVQEKQTRRPFDAKFRMGARVCEAIRKHGAIKGSLLAGWRVLRCNPFNPGGFDPVP